MKPRVLLAWVERMMLEVTVTVSFPVSFVNLQHHPEEKLILLKFLRNQKKIAESDSNYSNNKWNPEYDEKNSGLSGYELFM